MVGPFLYRLQFFSVAYKMKDCVQNCYSFKTHSPSSIRDSVEILLSFRKSRAFLVAINPSSCGILGYRPTTPIVHSITSSGKG